MRNEGVMKAVVFALLKRKWGCRGVGLEGREHVSICAFRPEFLELGSSSWRGKFGCSSVSNKSPYGTFAKAFCYCENVSDSEKTTESSAWSQVSWVGVSFPAQERPVDGAVCLLPVSQALREGLRFPSSGWGWYFLGGCNGIFLWPLNSYISQHPGSSRIKQILCKW